MNSGCVWQVIDGEDSDTPSCIKNVYENYFERNGSTIEFTVGLDGVYNVVQVEDAQRGMTNSKIKYLFKNKKYYKYDGSVERTFEIYNDWNTCIGKVNLAETMVQSPKETIEAVGRSMVRSFLRPTAFSYWTNKKDIENEINNLKETALDSYIDAFYYQAEDTITKLKDEWFSGTNGFQFARDFNGDGIADIASLEYSVGDTGSGDNGETLQITENTKLTRDPRNPDLISNIDLTTESLAAFSILENTHSADADYAYRDLKELFCELDYFDKEDLTEPATDILEWLLPDSGSYGWPRRLYDKQNEYGSMIHSKKMYESLSSIMIQAAGGSIESDKNAELEQKVADGAPEEGLLMERPEKIETTENVENLETVDSTEPTASDLDDSSTEESSLKVEQDKLYALSKVSSRSKSSVYIDPVDELEYDDFSETGYKYIVNANGIKYKSYKQFLRSLCGKSLLGR